MKRDPLLTRLRLRCAALVSSVGRMLALVLVAIFALAQSSTAQAQTEAERALEHRVKAAFLYRFTEYVNWPNAARARPDAPFVIAVVGSEPVAEELRQITIGRTVSGRPVEVRRAAGAEAMAPAQIVFIADSERQRLRDVIRAAPRNALVVTETEGALAQGSVINFVLLEGRVRFEISLDSAEKRALRLSSRLLAVAQSVRPGTH